jgi:AcrR family transcriptional regulator
VAQFCLCVFQETEWFGRRQALLRAGLESPWVHRICPFACRVRERSAPYQEKLRRLARCLQPGLFRAYLLNLVVAADLVFLAVCLFQMVLLLQLATQLELHPAFQSNLVEVGALFLCPYLFQMARPKLLVQPIPLAKPNLPELACQPVRHQSPRVLEAEYSLDSRF